MRTGGGKMKRPGSVDTALNGKALAVARIVWLVVAAITAGFEIISIPPYYRLALTPCTGSGCSNIQPSLEMVQSARADGVDVSFLAATQLTAVCLATLVYLVVAAVIFLRKSDDRMALFSSLILVLFSAAATSPLQALMLPTSPVAVPANIVYMAGQVCFGLLFSVFPNGRFVPGWMLLVTVVWFLAWLAKLFPATSSLGQAVTEGPLFPPFVLILIAAQVYRYRRVSNTRERQQTKWVVFGFGLSMGLFVAIITLVNLFVPPSLQQNWLGQIVDAMVIYGLIALIPVSIGVAIVRSRLYDIDVLINRTLVYGGLTASLALVYWGGVGLLQAITRPITGGGNDLAIVATTLLIAALFLPLRRAIQRFIDRRFYRRKYDAARTLSTFGQVARDEVDLGALTDRLVGVVEETMQPSHISLWLRPSSKEAK